MMRPPHPTARRFVPALLAILAVACGGADPDEAPEQADTSQPEENAAPEPTEDAPGAATSDDATDDDQPGPEDAGSSEPLVVDLDLEERTANGTVFRVHRLEVADPSILVDVEIIGAADTTTMWFNNQVSTRALIEDDLGNEYPLIPPDGNSSLMVSGGEQLEGTLAYQGPLHAGVRALTLRFNDDSDPDSTNQNDRMYPYFRFGPIDIAAD